jgi:hypothetical protein
MHNAARAQPAGEGLVPIASAPDADGIRLHANIR